MCPGLRADLEGRKRSCEFLPTIEFRGRAHLQPGAGTYLQPLPIHCGGVELEALGVLGAGAGGGVALRASAVGLPVLWGTERGCPHCPRGSASSQGRQVGLAMPCWAPVTGSEDGGTYQDKGGTYQDNWADVGWEQDVVPQWAPITLWLHVGGTLVVELERGRKGC